MKIKDRIKKYYTPGIERQDLMLLVFPRKEYPKAWNYSTNGGPPGCAMAFGRALREMGGSVYVSRLDCYKTVHLPVEDNRYEFV